VIIFVSGLLMSMVLYRLGSYSNMVYLYTMGSKVLLALLLAVALVMLLMKLWGMYRSYKFPSLQ